MSKKSYLSQQIKLMTLTTTDLFTDEEVVLYQQIMGIITEMDRMDIEAKKAHRKSDKALKAELLAEKKDLQKQLDELILKHNDKPRVVRIASVVDSRTLKQDDEGNPIYLEGVTWRTLRNSRKIAEFCSDLSRQLGLKHDDVTFDKIILKWKSIDVLHQIVLNGFYLPIMTDNGVEMRHFDIVTASAGQLRTDKVQCLSDDAWHKIKDHMQCGLDWDTLNAKGGLNISKLLAYTALDSSATDPWPEIDWDKVIVIKDFSGNVTGMVDFIHPNYTVERGVRTVEIKHTDGCGMVRPDIMNYNAMVRGKYIKGLLSPFDWIRFCRVHNVQPVLTDAWGVVHDLVAEDIQVILTTSQFKLWKFYDSWEAFKALARKNNCILCRTNFEESYIPDTTMNYQFIESLVDFTDEEMEAFTQKTWDRIKGIASDAKTMLKTLQADEFSDKPYKRALYLYAPLLRDGYSYKTLRDIKKRWTEDAQSGRLLCESKRLFAIPDLYAACEYWFLGIKEPKGLLEDGEVRCRIYQHKDEVDCLRSPSLYMEHAVRRVNHSTEVASWLTSNGIYTSCHDLISRILQFD